MVKGRAGMAEGRNPRDVCPCFGSGFSRGLRPFNAVPFGRVGVFIYGGPGFSLFL